ncbi:hypothetical protein B0H34DRAFT_275213 [Crassisporium funariophilum]|nr:hypothetical protein B0H34DRAFT_275213 [Crassisporium funariophilum]
MRRTAIIAGTTAALIAFMLMLLAAVFAYRRHKLRASLALGKKKEKKGLLDGEEFDDDDLPPGQHSSSSYHGAFLSSGRPGSPAPSLLKSRTSDAGSVFREEVWPPPGFVDPIEKRSNQVDLSKIVDDVMGPSATHGQSSSFASTSSTGYMGLPSASHDREPTDASTTSVHSTSSSAPLIGSNARHISDGHTYTDPFRSTPGSSSVYYPSLLPPGASAPAIPGSPTLSSRTRSSGPSYPTLTRTTPSPEPEHNQNQSQYQNLNAQPKKSSPLARALTGDAKLWLSRNVRQDPAPR